MKHLSQRRAFVGLTSIIATAFVIGIWRQKFSYQADFREDLLKISVCIALCTAIVIYVLWTLTHLKTAASRRNAYIRGALAGALTALIIIPLPNFAWGFKAEFLNQHQASTDGLVTLVLKAGFIAIERGLMTFVDITKASLIAVFGSAFIGFGVARYVQPKTA